MRRSPAAAAVTLGLVVIASAWMLLRTQPRTDGFIGRWRFVAQDSLEDAAAPYRLAGDVAGLARFKATVAREGLRRLGPFEVTIAPDQIALCRVAFQGAPDERGRWATAPSDGIIFTLDIPAEQLSGSVLPPETFQLFWRGDRLWLDAPGALLLPLRRLPPEIGVK